MKKLQTIKLEGLSMEEIADLFGFQDKYCKLLSRLFEVDCSYRDDCFMVNSSDLVVVGQIEKVLKALIEVIRKPQKINERDVIYAVNLAKTNQPIEINSLYDTLVSKTANGKSVYPKTAGQKQFVDAMKGYDIVFSIGPAGTGKTYLAVVYAVELLRKGDIKRIVLTRPAVEAGESLGFLPGDLKEKVDPYLRPLYDALHDMLGVETVDRFIEKGSIEIAPLAYMRGRTLEDAFIILDEAQNTTTMQMKMFLTRMGFHSKMVITGDVTQIDLGYGKASGLIQAKTVLGNVEDIKFIELKSVDVVRNPLVQKIIDCYQETE